MTAPQLPTWTTRAETGQPDRDAIREVLLAAFPTDLEADLVEALRADADAWMPELSMVATSEAGDVVGYSLLSRCHVGDRPALALGPCAVLPAHQKSGAGSAAIRAGLDAARDLGEGLVVVLGHADYYPRFGFDRASRIGVTVAFDVPDENLMTLALDPAAPAPQGIVRYPPAFGV